MLYFDTINIDTIDIGLSDEEREQRKNIEHLNFILKEEYDEEKIKIDKLKD